MEYPKKVAFEILESVHPEVEQNREIFEMTDDLLGGGQRLKDNLDKYLFKKPDEDAEIYKYRKKLFTYVPILGQCLAQLLNRMTASNHTINGLSESPKPKEFWLKFRESVDGNHQKEKAFIKEVFFKLLKYEKVYAVIEKDYTDILPKNKKEEEDLGLMPYIALYDPRSVIHYQELNGKLQWIKIRELETNYSPVGETKYALKWTFIDDTHITTYRCPLIVSNSGKLEPDVKLEFNSGSYMIPLHEQVAHERGTIPVVKIQIPENLWVTKEAIFLVLEHIRVHNNLTYSANVAGQIQRLFTPMAESADKMIDLEEARGQTGNHRVLIGQGFTFNETTGTAINTIAGYLGKLESRIKDLIFSNGISAGDERPMQESGVAKSMDFISQEQALASYGEQLLFFLEECYKLVGLTQGFSKEDISQISVSGLNEFVLDTVDTKVNRISLLEALDTPISNTAMRLVVEDLQRALTPNASIIEQEIIHKETLQDFSEVDHPELGLEELTSLVLNQIVSVATAQELLGFDPTVEWDRIKGQMLEMQAIQKPESQTPPTTDSEKTVDEGQTVDHVETVVTLANALASLSNSTTEDILASVNFNEDMSPEETKPIVMKLAEELGKLVGATPEEVLEGVGYEA